MEMQGDDRAEKRLDELLGMLKEPVPPERLERAWGAIESRLEWRESKMSPFAFTFTGSRPRLTSALAAAALLLLALIVGINYAPMKSPGFGGLLGSRDNAPPRAAALEKSVGRDDYLFTVTTPNAEPAAGWGGEDALSDVPLGGQGGGGKRTMALRRGAAEAAPTAGYAPGQSRAPGGADAGRVGDDRSRDMFNREAQALAEEVDGTASGLLLKQLKTEAIEKANAPRTPPPAPAAKPARPDRDKSKEQSKGGQAADGRPAAEPAPAKTAQKVIKTAVMELEVEKFETASRRVDELVTRCGGFYADSKTTQNDDGTSGGYFVIRVPQDAFEDLYAELKKLGRVKVENAKGVDVTAQYTDLDARIRNLEHMEERLLALLAEKKKGDKMSEILEIERELGKRREEIEQLKGEMRVLSDKISLSTIYLTLAERGRTVPGADFSVEVKDAAAADKSLDPLLAGLGGQVASRQSVKRNDGTLQVDLTLKVPMPRFGELVAAVKGLGRPDRENVEGFNPAAINSDPGAKDVMSTVSLKLFEPSRQKPGGVAKVEVKTLDGAAVAIGELLKRVNGTMVSRTEQRDADNRAATATYKLSVARKDFSELALSIETLGRVENKNMVGVDVVDVDGPAAAVPCEMTLIVSERPREEPGADATVTVADLGGAAEAVRALLTSVEGQVVSHSENRQPGGTSSADFVLRCTQARFNQLLDGMENIGRVDNKSVRGMDLQAVEGAAASALCQLRLRLLEKVPSATLGIEVADAAEATRRINAAVKSSGGRTERVDRQKSATGSSTDVWHLRIPVRDFEGFVAAMESVGEVKAHNVQGLGEEAKAAASAKALADVRLTVVRPDSVTAASEGTFRGTLRAAFKTLWWLLAALIYGLIVIVPLLIAVAFVIKALVWMLRPRRRATAAAPAGDASDRGGQK